MESISQTVPGAGEAPNGNAASPDSANVRKKVKVALTAAKSAVADTAAQLRDQAQYIGNRADTLVREKPWAMIGVAALVGAAVGILVSRRSR